MPRPRPAAGRQSIPGSLPTVTAVVVNWNKVDLTLRCVESLQVAAKRHGRAEVVVVDNGSTDDSATRLAASLADVTLVRLDTNRGFAAGANAGVAASAADVIALVNNDAVVEAEYLTAIVAPFSAADVGATTGLVLLSGTFVESSSPEVGLTTRNGQRFRRTRPGEPAGHVLVNSTGNEVTRSGNGRDRDWLRPYGAWTAPRDVFGFNGGACAIRRRLLNELGPLRDDLFMYYEDTEFSWRLRRHGSVVEHVPDAIVHHDHAASSGVGSTSFARWNARNRLLVAILHAPWPVVARGIARTAIRTILGPRRSVGLRALGAVALRLPRLLGERRQIAATSTVRRSVVAGLLVPD